MNLRCDKCNCNLHIFSDKCMIKLIDRNVPILTGCEAVIMCQIMQDYRIVYVVVVWDSNYSLLFHISVICIINYLHSLSSSVHLGKLMFIHDKCVWMMTSDSPPPKKKILQYPFRYLNTQRNWKDHRHILPKMTHLWSLLREHTNSTDRRTCVYHTFLALHSHYSSTWPKFLSVFVCLK